MATKIAAEQADQHIDVEIEATVLHESGGRATLRIEGVQPMEMIGFQVVEQMLQDNGIAREEALIYAERFVRMVQNGELARVLAERMTRVG